MGWIILVGLVVMVVIGSIASIQQTKQEKDQAAKDKLIRQANDPKLLCPHCQQFGYVTTEPTTVKKGISGGKATAALLTGGISMLATGLSQEATMTKATCSNCRSTWLF